MLYYQIQSTAAVVLSDRADSSGFAALEKNEKCVAPLPKDTFSTTEKMPCRRIRAHYKQLSEFESDRIIGLEEAEVANWRIVRHMARSDAAIEDAGKNG
ncbi:hypothetical protein TNCV_1533821 [Trichonephila clavipes]|nr:hypothetical protein TNCV_1533821 [Trichonephila clavipes]